MLLLLQNFLRVFDHFVDARHYGVRETLLKLILCVTMVTENNKPCRHMNIKSLQFIFYQKYFL